MDGTAIPTCLSITTGPRPAIEAFSSYQPIDYKHFLFTGLNHIASLRDYASSA